MSESANSNPAEQVDQVEPENEDPHNVTPAGDSNDSPAGPPTQQGHPKHRPFFPPDSDPLDPFVEQATRRRGSVLKPILMLAVIILLASLIPDYKSELAYYFESDDPVELGAIHDYPSRRANDPNFAPPLHDNTYVHLEGIPMQRGKSNRNLFFRLAGDDIFVETPVKAKSEIEALSEQQNAREVADSLDRSYIDVTGRLRSFANLSGRYNGVRRYYSKNYLVTFCETLTPETIRDKKQRRRDAIITQWKEEYNAMTPEQHKKSHMKPLPSPEELAKLEGEPICINAYLVQAGKKPSDFIWYIIGLCVIVVIIAFNLVMIVRWWGGK